MPTGIEKKEKETHMSQLIKKSITLVCTLALVIGGTGIMTGCNTTEGVGKDVEAAGDGLKDAARDAKD